MDLILFGTFQKHTVRSYPQKPDLSNAGAFM
jgi:hypothetical protein